MFTATVGVVLSTESITVRPFGSLYVSYGIFIWATDRRHKQATSIAAKTGKLFLLMAAKINTDDTDGHLCMSVLIWEHESHSSFANGRARSARPRRRAHTKTQTR